MNTLNVYNTPVLLRSTRFEIQTKTWLRFMRPSDDGKNTWYIGTVRQTLPKFTLHDERENVTDSRPVDPSSRQ